MGTHPIFESDFNCLTEKKMKLLVGLIFLTQSVLSHGHENHNLNFNPNDEHEREHMLEHLKQMVGDKDTKEMTPEELQFYYFKQHDYDNNNQLDGIELIQAMTHYERMDLEDRGGNDHEYPRFTEEQFIDMVKGILDNQDKNNDGYVDYFEFQDAQKSRADAAK